MTTRKLFDHSEITPADDFKKFSNTLAVEQRIQPSLVITQENKLKFQWDLFITVLLLTVCTVMPVHIVFQYESVPWCIVFFTIDFMFLIDIVLSFFTSIPETENEDEVLDRKKIAVNYLQGWFSIDFLSIIPFQVIFERYETYNIFQF